MPVTEQFLGHEAQAATQVVGKGATKTIKVIDAGWGSSGYYSPEVLKETASEAFPKGTHMYVNHPSAEEQWSRPERDIKDIAGVLATEAAWNETGPDGPGVYAKMSVRPSMESMVTELQDHIGVSINAMMLTEWGEDENGREGPIVQKLLPHVMNSVDLVTHAGRGGSIVRGNESAAVKEADAAYLHALGIPVPSTPKAPPRKGIKMADLTEEGATALAAAQTALANEMRLAREAATARAAESTVSPIQAAATLTTALHASSIPDTLYGKVIEDVTLGMDPVKAIERWKEIAALATPAAPPAGTESERNFQVHTTGTEGAGDLATMWKGLEAIYAVPVRA